MKYEVSICQTTGGLKSNAEQMLELVKSKEYKKYNYIVDASNCKAAQDDRKVINDELTKAKRERIDFERNIILGQWNPIKEKYMEAEKVLAGYIDHLDEGIKSVENAEKESKKAEIEAFFKENLNDLDIPFDIVFDKKYLNATCSKKKWQESIKKKISDHEYNYNSLAKMNVEDVELLQTIYTQVWDRMAAEEEYDKQIAAKKRAEELKQIKETNTSNKDTKPPVRKSVVPDLFTDESFSTETTSTPVKKVEKTSKLVTIYGPADLLEKGIKTLESMGLKVEEI